MPCGQTQCRRSSEPLRQQPGTVAGLLARSSSSSWANKGKVSWIEEQAPPPSVDSLLYLGDFTVVESRCLKITNLLTDKRHSQFLSVVKQFVKRAS